MLVLESENSFYKHILYDNGTYSIVDNDKSPHKPDGVGVIADNKDVIGIYLNKNNFYFLHNDFVTQVDNETFSIEIKSISTTEKSFVVMNRGEIICMIDYTPYISPEVIIGQDVDEFDQLKRFAGYWGKFDAKRLAKYISTI